VTATAEPEATSGTTKDPGAFDRVLDVLDERLGLKALQYPVPEHANGLPWSLGGLTAAALFILIVTGILMTQHYNPDPAQANASVRNLAAGVWGGGFVRGVHFWAAQAMYVLAALHLLRVFLTGSYKRPREANWLIGVTMFALTIGAIFTGSVIKWDQEGFEALGHNLEIAKLLGGVGFWFKAGFAADLPLLVRLYVAHVVIIPGLILGLFAVHGALIKRHGISPSPTVPDGPQDPSEPFTHHLRRIGAFSLALISILGILAVLFPPGVGSTPVEGIEVTKPLWMFWWVLALENRFGLKAILWGSGGLFVLLYAVPFIDRNPQRWWRKRPVAMGIGLAVLATMAILSIMTLFTTATAHLG
jgi:quinol-cytochrome oxidoreductase complex cytochrome b subunit